MVQFFTFAFLFRFRDCLDNKEVKRPEFPQRGATELWQPFNIVQRKSYQRSRSDVLLSKHPSLSPKMRTILLDWLIEVCEVYRLHRETFYLAADFFDRYMSKTNDVPKTKLQLIGMYVNSLQCLHFFTDKFN